MYLSQDPIGLAGNNPTLYGYVYDSNTEIDVFGMNCWNAARKKFWKNEAINNPQFYSKRNLKRMAKGNAPKMKIEVRPRKNNPFGKTKKISVPMELHHTHLPQRGAGDIANEQWNLTKATPWGHESMDKYRHTGYDLVKVINGTNSW
jgi:hypothetical protein